MKKIKRKPFGYEGTYPKESNPPPPEAQNREDQDTILGLIASLHLNSDYSDLTIFCKDKIFSAHRLVVCPRSKYFQNACYGGFKETEQPIRLNEKEPILIEKMLEFLYTGNYTPPCPTQPSEIVQADGGDIPGMDRQPAEEPSLESPPENDVIDEFPLNHASKEGDERVVTKPLVESLVDCHPCYFHVRMYGEADYFMIDDLKRKAEVHFCASLLSSPKTESFEEAIEELYSTRANYHKLRQVAIGVIVANLPNLRNGPAPVITPELTRSIPDFTYDLLQATLDKYVQDPPDVEEHKDQSQLKVEYWGSSRRY
ncbi:uncharacterized protein N7482_001019 [Penicillium canariense]|uniref:BTB domain-containing protein n=1 Tax=Penicillium canariense TaxID=189055 RepID=A0A9W9LTQ1_9EURO|nr:uncharacterized protein N7482_001019 [Penicillium canariense]KAJ5175142.1 hypothetical protein N7482_001019 [Penicillium canariense]